MSAPRKPGPRVAKPAAPVYQRVDCADCNRLIQQLSETRLDERKKAIDTILKMRVLPPQGEWDVCANHTLEQAARRLADFR
jgi:hypothetical protein